MNPRQYILDSTALSGSIRGLLRRYFDVAVSEVSNIDWIVPQAFDDLQFDTNNTDQRLIAMRIPSDEAKSLARYIRSELQLLIRMHIGAVEYDHRMVCEQISEYDLKITVVPQQYTHHVPARQPPQVVGNPDPIIEFRNNVRASLENGDWVSENIRRIAGVQ